MLMLMLMLKREPHLPRMARHVQPESMPETPYRKSPSKGSRVAPPSVLKVFISVPVTITVDRKPLCMSTRTDDRSRSQRGHQILLAEPRGRDVGKVGIDRDLWGGGRKGGGKVEIWFSRSYHSGDETKGRGGNGSSSATGSNHPQIQRERGRCVRARGIN